MAKKPEKVAMIGLDCALPHLIEQHIKEGHLPTFKKLIENGVIADNCLVPFPTITPPNWVPIGTGAWAGTHSVTDFHVHEPGTPLDNMNVRAAFSSERVTADYDGDLSHVHKRKISSGGQLVQPAGIGGNSYGPGGKVEFPQGCCKTGGNGLACAGL
jgi:hypothetical protein